MNVQPDGVVSCVFQQEVMVGHSYGNAVNYEMSQNLSRVYQGTPTGLLLDPASRASGLHINDYGQIFDREKSLAVYTDSTFDERDPKNLGVPSQKLDTSELGFTDRKTLAGHGYGIDQWAPEQIDACWSPWTPRKGPGDKNFPDDTETEDAEDDPGFGEDPAGPEDETFDVETVRSRDPNDKAPWHPFADPGEVVRFTIRFENVMTATAPAQDVYIFDNLDNRLDWSTVRVLDAGFGDIVVPLQSDLGAQRVQAAVTVDDYRPNVGGLVQVQIDAAVDPITGQVTWTFLSLDPDTGQPPLDALAGFLPPNDDGGRGEGFVTLEVRLKSDVPLGTVISNQATIVFDFNEEIITPPAIVTVGEPAGNSSLYLPILRR